LRDIARDRRRFDLVHVHSPVAVEMADLSPCPVLCTVHHDACEELSALYRRQPLVRLVGISRSQARREPAGCWAVVHHGLDPARHPAMPDQGYLLFLGRYDRVKGLVQAIEVAAEAGLPLVMAGETHDPDYFERQARPLMRKHGVIDLGPVGGDRKRRLIARARAVLFPIQWEEPFGLVLIESLLSGVPVLATARGSVPEIVEDGVNGVICDDASEMVGVARAADRLFDRGRIRQLAAERWSAGRMADDYLRLYRAACAEQPLDLDLAAGA
jgi:glycosyltransferase involved in cell wall biosynthesis